MFYFSASALNNYLGCRNRYYLANHLKVERPITIPMALGTSIHSAIEKNEEGNFKEMCKTF